MCGYALARWGGFILPYTAAVVVTPSPRCNAGVCFVTKCEYVPCSLTICRSLEFLCSKHIVIEASVFHAVIHIQAFLSTFFSTTYPIPLCTPRGTLGTPVSFALLVRCCGIEKYDRNIGTGSSGRVTQVFALSPTTRWVPYFKEHKFVFLEP